MKQIATAKGEVNASAMQAFLIMYGIESKFAPARAHSSGVSSPTGPYHLFVEEGKAKEALKLLKEQGLIDS